MIWAHLGSAEYNSLYSAAQIQEATPLESCPGKLGGADVLPEVSGQLDSVRVSYGRSPKAPEAFAFGSMQARQDTETQARGAARAHASKHQTMRRPHRLGFGIRTERQLAALASATSQALVPDSAVDVQAGTFLASRWVVDARPLRTARSRTATPMGKTEKFSELVPSLVEEPLPACKSPAWQRGQSDLRSTSVSPVHQHGWACEASPEAPVSSRPLASVGFVSAADGQRAHHGSRCGSAMGWTAPRALPKMSNVESRPATVGDRRRFHQEAVPRPFTAPGGASRLTAGHSNHSAVTWTESGIRPHDEPCSPRRSPSPVASGHQEALEPHGFQARLQRTLNKVIASGQQRAAAEVSKPKEVRAEVFPEVPRAVSQTIRRIIGGEDVNMQARLPPERQSNHLADELAAGARDLTGGEREKIANVFKELAMKSMTATGTSPAAADVLGMTLGATAPAASTAPGAFEDKKETLEVNYTYATIPSSEVAKRLKGRLSNAHIQRLCIYLCLPKRVSMMRYAEKVSLLAASSPEKRLRVCFGLLDVDGDNMLGSRDVFAALCSTRSVGGESAESAAKVHDAVFLAPGPVGIDFSDAPVSALEVVNVATAGPAYMQGVQPGDRLFNINGVEVQTMAPWEVRAHLSSEVRPLDLLFKRGGNRGTGSLFSHSDFERLLRALKSKDRLSTKVKVTIVSARGLPKLDSAIAAKSCPYCACEISGKPHTKFQTKHVNDSLDPVWNETLDLADFVHGDSLRFNIRDRDLSFRNAGQEEQLLGRATLPTSKFASGHFEGELPLVDAKPGSSSFLRVKVVVLNEAGLGFQVFSEIFADREPAFLSPLVEALTGIHAPPAGKNVTLLKIRVAMISASGLRNADKGDRKPPDTYCVCDILPAAGGKPKSKVQSKLAIESSEPVWNDRREIADYAVGDSIRFAIYEKDHNDEVLLFQVFLKSDQFYPQGFEGELALADSGGGKGYGSVLRVKITMPLGISWTTATGGADAGKSKQSVANADLHAEMQLRHEVDLADLCRRMQGAKMEEEVDYFSSVFDALRGSNFRIRREQMVANAELLFGIPCGRLSGRFYELVDADGQADIGVRELAVMLDRYRGRGKTSSAQRVMLAFGLYDLDGDGVITMHDAIGLAQEVEQIRVALGDVTEGPFYPICEEMRWLCLTVANLLEGNGVDSYVFKQLLPEPVIASYLLPRLEKLGQQKRSKPIPGQVSDLRAA